MTNQNRVAVVTGGARGIGAAIARRLEENGCAVAVVALGIIKLSNTPALGNRGQANNAAAKAGVQGFTKTLALELGTFGATANAIALGFVETEMTEATAARVGVPFDEFKEAALGRIPVGRTGVPSDIAHAASFFASEGAGYVTGQVLYVAGGASIMKSFTSIEELSASAGTHLDRSTWGVVDQSTIDIFASATGDDQQIHVDPKRATAAPLRTAIAHGDLTHALIPRSRSTGLRSRGIAHGNQLRGQSGPVLSSARETQNGHRAVNTVAVEVAGASSRPVSQRQSASWVRHD